jgi:uncharacterized protein (TIGR04255 family)
MLVPVRYGRPPIQEALCEVHFDGPPLKLLDLQKLIPVWSAELSGEQRVIEEKNVNFNLGPNGIQFQEDKQGHRLICRSPDNMNLVQASGAFIVVNRLAPYPGWNEFFAATIMRRVAELQGALGERKIRRIGLRYINRIEVPQVPFVWSDWFAPSLTFPDHLRSGPSTFQAQLHKVLEAEIRLIINLSAVTPATPEGKTPVFIDLDVIWEGAPIEVTRIRDQLDRVHSPHRLAFEGYLTDKVRNLFVS